jgi:hypothetical protein
VPFSSYGRQRLIVPRRHSHPKRGLRYLYANDVAVIHAEEDEPGKKVNGVDFVGTDGKLFVNHGYLARDPVGLIRQPLGDTDVHLVKSPGHQADWVNSIRSWKRTLCDVEVGAGSVTVCHLGNLAYWNHVKLRWDPEHRQFVGDEEANTWLDRERRDPWPLPEV